MRRLLSLPIVPAALPHGVTLVQYTRATAMEARELMKHIYPGGLGDNNISFEGFWEWLTTDPGYDPDLMFVAAANGAVVGLCHCWREDFVKDLFVDAAFRERGLGTALLTMALDAFLGRGAEFVDLKTDVDNFKAQSLYRRLSFVVVERIED